MRLRLLLIALALLAALGLAGHLVAHSVEPAADPMAPWEPPPGFVYPTSSTTTSTLAPTTSTTLPPTTTTRPRTPVAPTSTSTTRPATTTTAQARQPAQDALGACQAAIMRNATPLAPGASERCSGSPVYAWGVTRDDTGPGGVPTAAIFYHPGKVQAWGGSMDLWDYVVAHERAHAAAYQAGAPEEVWTDEGRADAGAARYYPAATSRWSPYR